jgi:hypothetical protein
VQQVWIQWAGISGLLQLMDGRKSFCECFILHSMEPVNNTGSPRNKWANNIKMDLEAGVWIESTVWSGQLLWTRWKILWLAERMTAFQENNYRLFKFTVKHKDCPKTRSEMTTIVESNVNYTKSFFLLKSTFARYTFSKSIIFSCSRQWKPVALCDMEAHRCR